MVNPPECAILKSLPLWGGLFCLQLARIACPQAQLAGVHLARNGVSLKTPSEPSRVRHIKKP
ncbi:hypothetical protein QWI17_00700, partial [Gilvimarinus sp. SDUM040013]|uniref:hypothetical protein n=1 Tax=Gilvimarinus gilvus TaxID=3058038 RepID=UPI002671CB94